MAKCGWIVNWSKSSFDPSQSEEFIGYQVSTALPAGSIQLSESRWVKLVEYLARLESKGSVLPSIISTNPWRGISFVMHHQTPAAVDKESPRVKSWVLEMSKSQAG